LTEIDYPNETFDLVFCERVLFLYPNPNKILKELTRVIKKESPIIASVSNIYVASLTYLSDELDEACDMFQRRYHHKLKLEDVAELDVHNYTPDEFK
jgi:ubiquinone/menaquinone biosynthesis C-methylase UbiE